MKWKTIKNHPNWEISNVGGLVRNKKTKELKSFHVHNNGYPCVSLDGQSYLIHRLVALAFVPNPENKPCVDHIDGNKSNADASNLRWATYHENNSNPNTSWKNSHMGHEPWNKGVSNPYEEETLAKMKDGSIKGIETIKQRAIERRQFPEWEWMQKEKRKEWAHRYYETHREEIRERNKQAYEKRKTPA